MNVKSIFKVLILSSFLSLSSIASDSIIGFSTDDINKESIAKSLELLKSTGKISEAEYKKALEELNKMQDKDITNVINKAKDVIENDPKKVDEIKKKLNL